MYINYKSDFSILVSFENGIPEYPWRMRFRTDPTPSIITGEINSSYSGGYIARFDGTSYTRAKVVSGSETDILIEFKDHGLMPGELRMEWDIMVQSDLFKGTEQRLVTPKLTPITLVESAGDEIDTTIIPILVPVIRGDQGEAFTYDMFTPEQIAALKGEKGESGLRGEKGDVGDPFTYDMFTPEQIATLKGEKGDIGLRGEKGDVGDPFTYDMFTPEQIATLKGEKGDIGLRGEKGDVGDPFTYDMFTPEQMAALKGEKGDRGVDGEQGEQGLQGEQGEKGNPFTYSDFTAEQIAALKGIQGDKGDKGDKGDTGEAGTSTELINDHVSITNGGINTTANPAGRGCVLDGIIAVMEFETTGEDYEINFINTWVRPGLGNLTIVRWDKNTREYGGVRLSNYSAPENLFHIHTIQNYHNREDLYPTNENYPNLLFEINYLNDDYPIRQHMIIIDPAYYYV